MVILKRDGVSMRILKCMDDGLPTYRSEIVRASKVSERSVFEALPLLFKQGLIERVRVGSDKTLKQFKITKKGIETVKLLREIERQIT